MHGATARVRAELLVGGFRGLQWPARNSSDSDQPPPHEFTRVAFLAGLRSGQSGLQGEFAQEAHASDAQLGSMFTRLPPVLPGSHSCGIRPGPVRSLIRALLAGSGPRLDARPRTAAVASPRRALSCEQPLTVMISSWFRPRSFFGAPGSTFAHLVAITARDAIDSSFLMLYARHSFAGNPRE